MGDSGSMRCLPFGPRALLVELEDATAVRALAAEVSRRRDAGWAPELVDVVPGARTLLLDGLADVTSAALEVEGWRPEPVAADTSGVSHVELDCVYDGPDLAAVAQAWGVSVPAAVAIHRGAEFTVDFCGFVPGFAYLSGLAPERAVPRRSAPRARVPAGSVALAGRYSGVYPRVSPGGWQLIGRTTARLWDAGREPPALLSPGTRVRFREVGAAGRE